MAAAGRAAEGTRGSRSSGWRPISYAAHSASWRPCGREMLEPVQVRRILDGLTQEACPSTSDALERLEKRARQLSEIRQVPALLFAPDHLPRRT